MLESFRGELKYKKLTEAEQKAHCILGRLCGKMADANNETRNGRLYGLQLWKNVFNDPIMIEKIKNRACFGELGHPADREEVDPAKIAICLAEVPKVSDNGEIYGVFDILDTPMGRILKTLCDYGCNIGVSSRGTGDVMSNGEVDPDTYNCECWDAVLIPAIKDARPQLVTESLQRNKGLKKVLQESIKKETVENAKMIKKTLAEEFDIDVNSDKNETIEEDFNNEIFTFVDDGEPNSKYSDVQVGNKIVTGTVVKEIAFPNFGRLSASDLFEDLEEDDIDVTDDVEDDVVSDENVDKATEEDEDTTDAITVDDLIKKLKKFDKDAVININPITVGEKEVNVSLGELVKAGSKKSPAIEWEINVEETEEETPEDTEDDFEQLGEEPIDNFDDELATDDSELEEPEDNSKEADDIGTKEIMESLKEMARQKQSLEREVKALKKNSTGNDVTVKKLTEQVNRYRLAFERTSEIAAKASKLAKENDTLVEQIDRKDYELKKLKSKNTEALAEGLSKGNKQIKSLKEELRSKNNELANMEVQLENQQKESHRKISESIKCANAYKNQCREAIDRYLSFRASMLGVRPEEIRGMLSESYSIDEVERACDKILNEGLSINKLPYVSKNTRMKVVTPKSEKARGTTIEDGYEIDDSLLEMAGLK